MKKLSGLVVLACMVCGVFSQKAHAYEYRASTTAQSLWFSIVYVDYRKGGITVTTLCDEPNFNYCPELYDPAVSKFSYSSKISVKSTTAVPGFLTAKETQISAVAAARKAAVAGVSSADSAGNALTCPAEGCVTTVAKQPRTTVPLVDVDIVVIPKISQSAPALPSR